MKLIIGGAYQGKLNYVKETYGIIESDVYVCKGDILSFDLSKKVITGFHLFILELVKNNIDALDYIKSNYYLLSDKIVISDDISCGVVPVDALLRKWREETGRILAYLSANADEVIRVFCGLGTKLK